MTQRYPMPDFPNPEFSNNFCAQGKLIYDTCTGSFPVRPTGPFQCKIGPGRPSDGDTAYCSEHAKGWQGEQYSKGDMQ